MTLILEIALGIVLGFILLRLLGIIVAVIFFIFVAALVCGVCALLIWGGMRLTGAQSVGEFFEAVALFAVIGIVATVFQTLYKRRSGHSIDKQRTEPPTRPAG